MCALDTLRKCLERRTDWIRVPTVSLVMAGRGSRAKNFYNARFRYQVNVTGTKKSEQHKCTQNTLQKLAAREEI